MIARDSFALFDAVLAYLPHLAPADALPKANLPQAAEDGWLSPAAMPPDPDRCAVIAVIDHAIPFAHRRLTAPQGDSRVAAIWLMDAPATDRRTDIPFGQELRGPLIDRLRRAAGDEDGVYRACGLMNPARGGGLLRAASHGAAVALLAAGHDPGEAEGQRHPLLAVSLPDFGVADSSGSLSALFIQAAVVWVMARARGLSRALSAQAGRPVRPPVVVNLSLGLTAGARDGSSLITRLQEAIAATPDPELGPVYFVLPVGNHRQGRLRAVLEPGQAIGWRLPPDDATPSMVEFWGQPGAAPVNLRVALPDGRGASTEFGLDGGIGILRDAAGRELARAILQSRASGRGPPRPCLTLIAPPTRPQRQGSGWAPAGLWSVILSADSPACEVMIQRDEVISGLARGARQSRLEVPGQMWRGDDGGWPGADDDPPRGLIRRNGTANSYAGGRHQIRVGGSIAGRPRSVAPYCGLLDDGTPGDVIACADDSAVLRGSLVPGLRGAVVTRMAGTSLSAARVTRWLAARLADGTRFADRDAIRAAMEAEDG